MVKIFVREKLSKERIKCMLEKLIKYLKLNQI